MSNRQSQASWEKWTRPWPPENLSSHWTIGLSRQWFFWLLGGLTIFHLIFAAVLPLGEDELYYWSWSKDLQLSYFDHPPLTAYLIRASTALFGNTAFGIRFMACVLGSATVLLLSQLSHGRALLSLLLFTPVFFWGSMLMTPDVPLLFFWSAYVVWLSRINPSLHQWSEDPITRVYHRSPVAASQWGVGGMLLGLGILSKYTMLLAIPCAFLLFALKFRREAWSRGFMFHLAVAAIIASPILIYNLQEAFQPLKFQWQHAISSGNFSVSRLIEFMGTQSLLISALPFLFLFLLLVRAREFTANPVLHVCFYFFVPPLFFFLYKVLRGPIEGNWALVAYLSFWALASQLIQRSSLHLLSRSFVALSFFLPLAISVGLCVHYVYPLAFVPPAKDRFYKSAEKFELMQQVAQDLQAFGTAETVYAPTYQLVSYLRFHQIPTEQIPFYGRQSHFTRKPTNVCDHPAVLTVSTEPLTAALQNCFPNYELLKEYRLSVRGNEVETYRLARYSK